MQTMSTELITSTSDNAQTDTVMEDYMSKRVQNIKQRSRNAAKVEVVNADGNEIKSVCMAATKKMMEQLSGMTDSDTCMRVGRFMGMVSNSVPLRLVCIGISPYENGILPTFAGGLSYSPMKCSGSTPSVQVLTQCMSMCASSIKFAYSRVAKVDVPRSVMDRDRYTRNFAQMLRCSYACLCAGVAFVNSSPVITSNAAKMVRCMSVFSEWLGSVIEIHSKYGHKLTIICMGKDAETSAKNCFKANKGMIEKVNYMTTANPALISRMNVNKDMSYDPIPRAATGMELLIDKCMGVDTVVDVRASFDWYSYPDALLVEVMNMDAISALTRQLVDHAPDQLLDRYLRLISKLYRNMDDDAIAEMMGGVNNDMMSDAGGNQMGYVQSTVPNNNAPQESTFQNPFLAMNAMSGSSRGANTGEGMQQSRSPFAGGDGDADGRKFEGPPMIGRRSTIAQLIDPTGKSVSQQVIVVSSMLKTVQDVTTAYKESQKEMMTLASRQVEVVRQMNMRGIINDDVVESTIEYLDTFKEKCENYVTKMIDAYSIFAGLPHVIEGDRGVYEQETQPMAPLMRRYDGTTMHETIYASSVERAKRNEEMSVATGSNSGTNATAINPFTAGSSARPTPITSANTDIITDLTSTVDMTHSGDVNSALVKAARRIIGDNVHKREMLTAKSMQCSAGLKSVMDIMQVLLCQYMSVHGNLPPQLVSNMVESVYDCTDEELDVCKEEFKSSIENETKAMSLLADMLD